MADGLRRTLQNQKLKNIGGTDCARSNSLHSFFFSHSHNGKDTGVCRLLFSTCREFLQRRFNLIDLILLKTATDNSPWIHESVFHSGAGLNKQHADYFVLFSEPYPSLTLRAVRSKSQ